MSEGGIEEGYIRISRNHILNMRHDSALIAARFAFEKGTQSSSVSALYFELSYWYCETGFLEKTGKEARTSVLGHIQRGGSPTAFDRVLATRFGLQAITAASEGDWGKMVALHGTNIVRVPLASATEKLKTVPLELYKEAEIFFG